MHIPNLLNGYSLRSSRRRLARRATRGAFCSAASCTCNSSFIMQVRDYFHPHSSPHLSYNSWAFVCQRTGGSRRSRYVLFLPTLIILLLINFLRCFIADPVPNLHIMLLMPSAVTTTPGIDAGPKWRVHRWVFIIIYSFILLIYWIKGHKHSASQWREHYNG